MSTASSACVARACKRSGTVAGSEVSSAGRASTASGLGVGRGEVTDPSEPSAVLTFFLVEAYSPQASASKRRCPSAGGTEVLDIPIRLRVANGALTGESRPRHRGPGNR